MLENSRLNRRILFQLITFIVLMLSFLQASNAQAPATISTPLIKLLERNSCPRCDLRGVDLSNMNLVGANLQYADLTGANLTRTNLRGANLSNAILVNVQLIETKLSGANLRNANLSDIDIDVTFEWIEIIGTQLEGTQFKYNVICGPPPVIGGWGCQHL